MHDNQRTYEEQIRGAAALIDTDGELTDAELESVDGGCSLLMLALVGLRPYIPAPAPLPFVKKRK